MTFFSTRRFGICSAQTKCGALDENLLCECDLKCNSSSNRGPRLAAMRTRRPRSQQTPAFGIQSPAMMKHILSAFALLLLSVATQAAPQTMRLDYYHTGDAKQEIFSVDRVVLEPLPWPGDLNRTIDDTNLGK